MSSAGRAECAVKVVGILKSDAVFEDGRFKQSGLCTGVARRFAQRRQRLAVRLFEHVRRPEARPLARTSFSKPLTKPRAIRYSYQAPMGDTRRSGPALVPGTLDMLILKTLVTGEMHGWGIANEIQRISRDVLRVEEGSLYPALRRLELEGCVKAEWATSDNNRRARYYTLTARGRKQLVEERAQWSAIVGAIARVLEA